MFFSVNKLIKSLLKLSFKIRLFKKHNVYGALKKNIDFNYGLHGHANILHPDE